MVHTTHKKKTALKNEIEGKKSDGIFKQSKRKWKIWIKNGKK